MRLLRRVILWTAVPAIATLSADSTLAQAVDNIIGFVQQPNTSKDIPGTTLNVTNDFPNVLIIDETNIDAIGFNFVDNPLESQGIDPDGDGDITTTIFDAIAIFSIFSGTRRHHSISTETSQLT